MEAATPLNGGVEGAGRAAIKCDGGKVGVFGAGIACAPGGGGDARRRILRHGASLASREPDSVGGCGGAVAGVAASAPGFHDKDKKCSIVPSDCGATRDVSALPPRQTHAKRQSR